VDGLRKRVEALLESADKTMDFPQKPVLQAKALSDSIKHNDAGGLKLLHETEIGITSASLVQMKGGQTLK
jgi:hypothetical protein